MRLLSSVSEALAELPNSGLQDCTHNHHHGHHHPSTSSSFLDIFPPSPGNSDSPPINPLSQPFSLQNTPTWKGPQRYQINRESCLKDFTGQLCPFGWWVGNDGDTCQAPDGSSSQGTKPQTTHQTYEGPCEAILRGFSALSPKEKFDVQEKCNAPWACVGEFLMKQKLHPEMTCEYRNLMGMSAFRSLKEKKLLDDAYDLPSYKWIATKTEAECKEQCDLAGDDDCAMYEWHSKREIEDEWLYKCQLLPRSAFNRTMKMIATRKMNAKRILPMNEAQVNEYVKGKSLSDIQNQNGIPHLPTSDEVGASEAAARGDYELSPVESTGVMAGVKQFSSCHMRYDWSNLDAQERGRSDQELVGSTNITNLNPTDINSNNLNNLNPPDGNLNSNAFIGAARDALTARKSQIAKATIPRRVISKTPLNMEGPIVGEAAGGKPLLGIPDESRPGTLANGQPRNFLDWWYGGAKLR